MNKYLLKLAEREPVEIPTNELELELLESSANGWTVIGTGVFRGLYPSKEQADQIAKENHLYSVQVRNGLLDINCPLIHGSFVNRRSIIESKRESDWPNIIYKLVNPANEWFGDRAKVRAYSSQNAVAGDCIIEVSRNNFPPNAHDIENAIRDFVQQRRSFLARYESKAKTSARTAHAKARSAQVSKLGQNVQAPRASDAVLKLEKQYGAIITTGSPVVFSVKKTNEVIAGTIFSVSKSEAKIKTVTGEMATVEFASISMLMHVNVCKSMIGDKK